MINKVNANDFTKALGKVSKVIAKTTIPILNEVKVEFKNNKCILTAANLDQWLTYKIDAEGEDFSFVFRDTKSIMKASKYFADDLEFDLNSDNEIILTSNKKTIKQFIYSANDYADLPVVESENKYSTNIDRLIEGYEKVSYAVSKSDVRPTLTGICFRNNQMIAVDGYRLAINTDNRLEVNRDFIIPAYALKFLNVFDKKTNVDLVVGDYFVTITDDNVTFISRLIADEFIKVDSIIPQDFAEEHEINVEEYLKQLKFLGEFVEGKNLMVKFEKGTLRCVNENGQYTADVPFGKQSNLIYGFNCSYMIDALSQQFKNSKHIDYKLKNSVSPIILQSENDLALVLPVRVQ